MPIPEYIYLECKYCRTKQPVRPTSIILWKLKDFGGKGFVCFDCCNPDCESVSDRSLADAVDAANWLAMGADIMVNSDWLPNEVRLQAYRNSAPWLTDEGLDAILDFWRRQASCREAIVKLHIFHDRTDPS